jgi:hypothetical protein
MGQEKYQLLAKAYEPDDQTLFVSLNTFSVLLPAVLIKLQLLACFLFLPQDLWTCCPSSWDSLQGLHMAFCFFILSG